MPNPCRICNHPDRVKIEQARLMGGSLRKIGKQYGVCYVGIHRHFKAGHVVLNNNKKGNKKID